MNDSIYTMNLPEFRSMFPEGSCLSMDDEICLVEAGYDTNLSALRYPCRFDGLIVMFCVRGRFEIMVDLKSFNITENTLFIYLPGSIFNFQNTGIEADKDVRAVVLAMTREYLGTLKVEIPQLMGGSFDLMRRPYIFMRDNEKKIASRYLSLAKDILASGMKYRKESIGLLISSVLFLGCGMLENQNTENAPASRSTNAISSRSREVLDRFLHLISEYHTKERSVAFYANRMCLTPKYLSKIIKASTGRTASAIIDDYVILEAKYLLRHTSYPVKEIVAQLNFPDAATFNKFFKGRTGTTPLKYRKA